MSNMLVAKEDNVKQIRFASTYQVLTFFWKEKALFVPHQASSKGFEIIFLHVCWMIVLDDPT